MGGVSIWLPTLGKLLDAITAFVRLCQTWREGDKRKHH